MSKDPFTLHSFGYGDDHDANLLEQISKKQKGNFYYVQDIELVSDNFIDCLGSLTSVIGKNASVNINLLQSSVFPEIRFKKTYGSMFSGNEALNRLLTLNNVTKGYSKDFMFEITLDKAENTENLSGTTEITIANAEFNVENLNKDKFTLNCMLKLVIHNGSASIEIQLNEEVMKNLIRVKGSEAMEVVGKLEEQGNYEKGEKLLDEMSKECNKYLSDPIIKSISETIATRKKFLVNSKGGIQNECNVAAFTKNMCSAYDNQENKAGFTGDMYQNRAQKVMSKNLQCKKSKW